MPVKTYFERLYPHIRTAVYYPSRKNSGIFVTLCFCAAGSNHFPFTKGKMYTSEDVPLQRILYDGTRTMTVDIKSSFHLFNEDGLAAFYIDIPDTPPHKGVKITVSMDARGFEGKSECKWIMADSDDNDCFPNSNTFTFLVSAKFEYQK